MTRAVDLSEQEGVPLDTVYALIENMDPRLVGLLDEDKFRYLLRSLRRAGLIQWGEADLFARKIRRLQ